MYFANQLSSVIDNNDSVFLDASSHKISCHAAPIEASRHCVSPEMLHHAKLAEMPPRVIPPQALHHVAAHDVSRRSAPLEMSSHAAPLESLCHAASLEVQHDVGDPNRHSADARPPPLVTFRPLQSPVRSFVAVGFRPC